MSEFDVASEIDTSESHNPVLRVQVKSKYGTRTYHMSLQSIDPDKQGWCQGVITTNFVDLIAQVETDTKRSIKTKIADTFSYLGLNFNQ